MLVTFTTAYLCDVVFSAVINMMTKYRSRLVKSELCVSLSKISPRNDNLHQAKQTHPFKSYYSVQILDMIFIKYF